MNIHNWIAKKQKESPAPFVMSMHKNCGFIEFANGRKAQIQITLEMDEDNW